MTLLNDMFVTVTATELQEQIEQAKKENGGGFESLLKNEYKVQQKPDGSGSMIVRILPPLATFENKSPYVDVRKHSLSFKGVRYDSLCPGFFNDDCPVCSFIRKEGINKKENNSIYSIYNYGKWENKKLVAPRLSAIEERWVNIYVVDDQVDPTNNDKIFQYKMPKDISEKFENLVKGDMNIAQQPSEPYDLIKGRNLYINFFVENGFRTYKNSRFLDATPLKNKVGKEIQKDKEFTQHFTGLIENMQDLYELIDVDKRMYSKEMAEEKFEEVLKVLNDDLGEGSGTSDRISDGFSAEVKTKTSGKDTKKVVDHKEFDELTNGSYDSKDVEVMDDVIDSIAVDGFGDLDALMDDILD